MRRRDIVGLSLLVPGVLPAFAALVALGDRLFPAADVARRNGMELAAVYFLGAEADSPAALALVLGWVAVGLVGIALMAAGYRLITTGPTDSPRPVDEPAIWHRFDV